LVHVDYSKPRKILKLALLVKGLKGRKGSVLLESDELVELFEVVEFVELLESVEFIVLFGPVELVEFTELVVFAFV
jgi:hypothetical protein